jgi:hypothetical protein
MRGRSDADNNGGESCGDGKHRAAAVRSVKLLFISVALLGSVVALEGDLAQLGRKVVA